MGAVFFYHMTQQPLEVTLPVLLGKARAAGWRILVRGTQPDRLDRFDETLWTQTDDFIPHGRMPDPYAAQQPILLSEGGDNPNKAECLISIDGAELSVEEITASARSMILFDGHTQSALTHARAQWKRLSGAGCEAKYWSQESGRWEMKAEAN